MVFKETLRVEYSPGYLDAYKGLTLEDIKAKAGPGQYIVDEGAQPGTSGLVNVASSFCRCR